jgi:signal transduction histidine kinase
MPTPSSRRAGISTRLRAQLIGYGVAVGSVLAVWLVRAYLDPLIGSQAPFVMFALSVVLASVVGGLGPGIVAVVLSSVVICGFFFGAGRGFGIADIGEVLALTLYVLQGACIALLGESRLRTMAILRAERAELAARVEERTRELSVVNVQLMRSNRELESFASIASHDLQEPLRKILAFGDRLKMQAGPALEAGAADSLARMLNAASRMQGLISDLLSFARVGSRVQAFTTVRLDTVVSEVLVDLESRIADADGNVQCGPLPEIEADALQMRQLFQNLLANALKFRRPDVPPVVQIEGRVQDGQVMIEVTDNGIGFEPQHAERIFGIFQRLHGRGTYDGTGIGLAICRRIIERHHGSLTAAGRPGEGATFSITLPLEQPA